MTSRSFPCDYDGVVCVRCKQEVAVGSMIRFSRPHSKDKEHETCPTPPPAPSARAEGAKPVGEQPPPPAAPLPAGDAPIYTYHHRIQFWGQGLMLGWVEQGVSVKGRYILPIEIEQVDTVIRQAATRNVLGELQK